VDHIIRALAIVRARIPNAHLEIVGTGSETEVQRLVELVRVLGISDAVKFHGRVSNDERDEIMRSLDVLAMTSLREGWGLVVSEAARYQVPSIAYPVPGLLDSVVNGKTGLVTEQQTPQSLAVSLAQLISDRALRERLGCAAAAYLRQFDEARFVGRWEKLLEAAVEHHT
jgi:glycosyltransferase involved in cell wall biosynthesis